MKKIISLFQRNYDGDRLVRDEITPGAEWVISGEGIATRKWDGTCCLIRAGRLYKRYDCKRGKIPPDGFEPAQEADSTTGHWPGWLPVGNGPEDRWHREAYEAHHEVLAEGTYELCGPRINGNPEEAEEHYLVMHGEVTYPFRPQESPPPRDFQTLKLWLSIADVEGIVWHHPDGRMVKIKTKDFGLQRRKI